MFIRQNDTGKIPIGPAVSTAGAMVTTLDISTADSAKAKLGDDTVVDISGYTWAATTGADGDYDLTLQTGITDTVGEMVIVIEDVSLCLPIRQRFFVVEEDVFDMFYAASAGGPLNTSTITGSIPSQGKPTATPTPLQVLMYVYTEYVRNKTVVNSGTGYKQVFADDGSTTLYQKAVADSAGVLTVSESETG